MAQPVVAAYTRKQVVASALMGAATALLGMLLLACPLVAARFSTRLLGWVLILVCMARLVFALHAQTIWNFVLIALRGALFGGVGGWLVFAPPAEAETLTALLIAMLLAGAGIEGGLGLLLRTEEGREWVLFDAASGFLMGVLILAGWPDGSVWAMGTLVGAAVVVSGVCQVMTASKMPRRAASVEPPVRAYRRAA